MLRKDTTKERYIHFGARYLRKVVSVAPKGVLGGMKPDGLWFSVEGPDSHGWKAWCEGERFRPGGLRYQTEITFADDAQMLRLSGPGALDAFTDRYGVSLSPGVLSRVIDWSRVAEDGFQGIIIAPYCWQRRNAPGMLWYYGWDCASGCVWNASAVKELKLLRGTDRV